MGMIPTPIPNPVQNWSLVPTEIPFLRGPAISTARAGNVIGGGDFAEDRIIPDCYRAAASHRAIELRNPDSIRPYQHVLEPLMVYLMILQRQCDAPELAGSYNVGPDEEIAGPLGRWQSALDVAGRSRQEKLCPGIWHRLGTP